MTCALCFEDFPAAPPPFVRRIWDRVRLWIRIPRRGRTGGDVQALMRRVLAAEGFRVHRVHVDLNASQGKFYVRPEVSGATQSARACVEVLANRRPGEVRLDAGEFVFQRDNTVREALFDRRRSRRFRIRATSGPRFDLTVLEPGCEDTSPRTVTSPRVVRQPIYGSGSPPHGENRYPRRHTGCQLFHAHPHRGGHVVQPRDVLCVRAR